MTTTVITGGGYVYAEVTDQPNYQTKIGRGTLKIQGEGRFDEITKTLWIKHSNKTDRMMPIPLFGEVRVQDNDKQEHRLLP